MKGIISVFGITNGIGHTLSSFNAFSVSTPVSTMDVMQSQHVSRNPEISNVKQVFGILIMEKMSVCKVGAALFLPSPSFTPSDQSMYFLTLQLRHIAGVGNPPEPCIDFPLVPKGFSTLQSKYIQVYFQTRPLDQLPSPWRHLGSLGTFNKWLLTSPKRDCGTQR